MKDLLLDVEGELVETEIPGWCALAQPDELPAYRVWLAAFHAAVAIDAASFPSLAADKTPGWPSLAWYVGRLRPVLRSERPRGRS